MLAAVCLPARVPKYRSVSRAAAAAEASNCKFGSITINCGYPVSEHVFSDGALQQFVIGTDAAVWTRWTNPRAWRPLP
ncbi:hypothetical protein ACFYU9_25840 [Streptomyces sp. NPDC004327]|uniref:hypothetical protein n=1 Tax=Streptomyces sp. NPDC004327 TaxID=3364699 RepID=UPI00368F65F3